MSDSTETPKRPSRGRPSNIEKTIYDPDGKTTTALERIPELIRVGMYLEPACGAAGIRPHAAYEWLRDGALASNQKHTAEQLGIACELTPYQEACIRFNHAVIHAETSWEVEQNVLLGQLARGGLQTTRTTVKTDKDGAIIETSTVTEILPPDAKVIEWRLTRRFVERYGHRIEVSAGDRGEHLTDVDVAEQLIGSVEEFLGAGREAESEM